MPKRRVTKSYHERAYLPNINELQQYIVSLNSFKTDKEADMRALDFVWVKLFGPGRVVCPNCNKLSKFTCRFSGDAAFRCNHIYCKYEINPLEGTIFGHTHVKLSKWFLMLYLMYRKPSTMTVARLSKELKVSEPTAGKMRRALVAELKREDMV